MVLVFDKSDLNLGQESFKALSLLRQKWIQAFSDSRVVSLKLSSLEGLNEKDRESFVQKAIQN